MIVDCSTAIKESRATTGESANIYFRNLNSSQLTLKYILPKPKWGLCHMQSCKAAFNWRRCFLGKKEKNF